MSSPVRVLLLEDNPDDAGLVQRILNRSDIQFEIRWASDGIQFADLLDSFAPEIILSDHQLPDFSSVQALKIGREKFPYIPFILVTGTVSDEFAASIIKSGADDYILKSNLKRLPMAIEQAIEKKRTEESLIKSEANLRSIFENTDTGYVLLDADFKIVSFNQLASNWGKSILKKPLEIGDSVFIHSVDGESERIKAIRSNVASGSIVDYEIQLKGPSSSPWFHVRFLPVKSNADSVNGASIAISDITNRKYLEIESHNAEIELLQAHHKLLFHIENAPLGFIEWDNQNHVRTWSKRAEEIFGWTEREMVDTRKIGLITVYADDLPWVTEMANQLSNGTIIKNKVQHRNVTKNGRVIWCEWFNSVQKNYEGEVTTIFSLVQDISAQKEAELQREFDKNNLEALINNTEDLMWSVDLELKLITSNTAFDNIVESIAGRPIPKGSNVLAVGFPQEQIDRYKIFYERAFSGESFTEVVRTVTPVENFAETSFYPIRRAGKVVGTACFSRDITSRIIAEKEVAIREQRFRVLIENSSDAIVLHDERKSILYQSPSVQRIFGFDLNDRGGKPVIEYVHPDDRDDFKELYRKLNRNKGQAIPFQYRFRHKEGHYIWLEGVITNLLHDPSVSSFVANYRDVTVRKTTRENLELTLKRFEQAQQIAHLGHWQVDFNTGKTYWSDEAFRIYGIKPGSIMPSEDLFVRYVHPDDLERVTLITEEASQKLKPFSFFHRIVQEGGHIRSLFSVGQYEFDKSNHPTGLYGISLDITELTEKEKELERANKELETFIYKTYHDLRSPIATVQGMVHIGRAEINDNKAIEYFDRIGQVAEKQSKMLQNLATVMIIRSRALAIRPVQLDALIGQITEKLKPIPFFEKVNFSVYNELGPEFTSDQDLLYNILFRLIENSVLYQDLKRPDPRVDLVLKRDGKDMAVIEVSDNGIGMPEKVKGKVFDMFYRGHEASKGSGLGLYLVKNAVQKLGGSIELTTEENKGSLFRITIPLH